MSPNMFLSTSCLRWDEVVKHHSWKSACHAANGSAVLFLARLPHPQRRLANVIATSDQSAIFLPMYKHTRYNYYAFNSYALKSRSMNSEVQPLQLIYT